MLRMSYTNDTKPLAESEVTWGGIRTAWEDENRSWTDYLTYQSYTFDSKPS